jgi:hypothetical protein
MKTLKNEDKKPPHKNENLVANLNNLYGNAHIHLGVHKLVYIKNFLDHNSHYGFIFFPCDPIIILNYSLFFQWCK